MTDPQTPKNQLEMTLSSASVKLANGTGAVTASVTNTAAQPQRVVLRVFAGVFVAPPKTDTRNDGAASDVAPTPHGPRTSEPTEPADPADWATIDESLRTIAAGATVQYTVSFNASSAPGGTYSVKLNAYSADEPPESKSGQTLSLELILPATPAGPKPRKFPWWMVAAAAGLVAVIVVVAFILWPRNTEVPELTGGTLEQAQKALADAGLGGQFVPIESTETPDTVLSQEPEAGTRVEPESVITVDFAVQQTVKVPNVANLLGGAARAAIEDSGLQLVLNPASTCTLNQSGCTVRGQLPNAGETVPVGSAVMLTISKNISTFPVPTDICNVIFCPQFESDELQKFVFPLVP